jgi:RHS repeat-associated protein
VNGNGVVEGASKYLPFGETLDRTGSLTTAKGYTGHEQTDASGLVYMQARFYLPMYGKFASPDPGLDQHAGVPQSWNQYSYVRNNPVMGIDPTGMYQTRLNGMLMEDNRDSLICGTSDRVFGTVVTGILSTEADAIRAGAQAQADPQNPGSKTSPDLYDVTHVSPDQPKGMSGNPANLDPLAVKWSEWEIAHNPGTGPVKNERSSFLIDPGTGKALPGTAMEGDGTGVATRKSAPLLPAGATILGDIHHHWNGKPGATGYDGDMAWNVSMTNSGRTGSAFGHPVSGDYRSYVLTNTPSGYDLYRVQSIATGKTWRFQVDLIWSK